MNKRRHTAKYLFIDAFSALVVWLVFINQNKTLIFENDAFDLKVILYSCFPVVIFWIILYAFSGYYYDIYRKSRVQELYHTFITSLIGTGIILAISFSKQSAIHIIIFGKLWITFFILHFSVTYVLRLILTSITISHIRNKKIGFNTLIIGSNGKAESIYHEFTHHKKSAGYKMIGFVNVDKKISTSLNKLLPHLGSFDRITEIITEKNVEEVIIAIEQHEHNKLEQLIANLIYLNIHIKIIPDLFEILIGQTEIALTDGTPLLRINSETMSVLGKNIKTTFDLFASLLFIGIMSPVYLFTALTIKATSAGPVIYKQKRIGKNGKEFYIYKFRSMIVDAEKNGPQLSFENDPRITKFGLFMRKTRLDEIPQFFNVLKGDMSIVGPRPERQFYINQILEKASEYRYILRVKPGITSLGQIKYGYAENLEEMLDRLKFDIIYVKNMSLYLDFKILINTILIVLKRDGK